MVDNERPLIGSIVCESKIEREFITEGRDRATCDKVPMSLLVPVSGADVIALLVKCQQDTVCVINHNQLSVQVSLSRSSTADTRKSSLYCILFNSPAPLIDDEDSSLPPVMLFKY